MRLGRLGTVLAALAGGLVLAAPAQAHVFNMPWGYAYIDDRPFYHPTTGVLVPTTQVFPRGVIRDVRPPDNRDVRITVLVFTPGDPGSQTSCVATEGDFVDKPFSCAIDIAPLQVSYLRYDFCRFFPPNGGNTDCQYVWRGRPADPQPGGGGGGGGGGSPPPPPNPDRDGDGVPGNRDCADNNATVRPGGIEIPGNKIDDDCTGGDAAARITATVKNGWRRTRIGWRAVRLRVVEAPTDATVEVRCLGKPCRFDSRKTTVSAKGSVNLRRLVRRSMPVRTTLEVRITAPNWIGKVVRYRIKRKTIPDGRRLCLPPNLKKPERC